MGYTHYKGFSSYKKYCVSLYGEKGYKWIRSYMTKTGLPADDAETEYKTKLVKGLKAGIHCEMGCFLTMKDAADSYGKDPKDVQKRAKRRDCTFAEALDLPVYVNRGVPVEIGGFSFKSTKAAEAYFGRKKESVAYLFELGVPYKDIPGYTNYEEYCNRWGVGVVSVRGWRNKGFGLRDSIARVLWTKRSNARSSNKSPRDAAYRSCFDKKHRYICTPSWLSKAERSAMVDMYQHARSVEGLSIDHVVPLGGESVCGLHVLSNLQYLTLEDNIEKSNEWDEGWEY